jgi:hypothetical protein
MMSAKTQIEEMALQDKADGRGRSRCHYRGVFCRKIRQCKQTFRNPFYQKKSLFYLLASGLNFFLLILFSNFAFMERKLRFIQLFISLRFGFWFRHCCVVVMLAESCANANAN